MLCPNCQRENEPTARFCIFCGSSLPMPGDAENIQGQTGAVEEEIRQLRQLIARITDRLDVLERGRGVTKPVPQPAPPITAPPPPPKATTAAPAQDAIPIPVAGAPPPKERPPEVREREWEQILGGSWLARIGVLALIIGIAFFLKFAFDNDWIGPTGRIILGIVAGLVMLGLGYYWQKKYPILTQVLSGGGIAVLYLSIFASFAIYDLVHIYVAVSFLLLVSAASALLALYYNSMSLAIIGILGAFAAPFILGVFGEMGLDSDAAGKAVQLLVYVIVVDIGVLILSTFRKWQWFTLLALVCSLIAFAMWYSEFDRYIGIGTAEIGITLIFLIFVGVTSLFHIIWRRIPQAFDYALMMINAVAYLGISLGIMWDDFRLWMGGFILLVAIFYGALSYISLIRSSENARLSLFALAIALIFLTIAIPVQLGDTAWTTIVWAVEFVLLMWLSFTLRMPNLRNYSYVIFLAMAVRLIFFDTTVDMHSFQPVLNERFLAFVVGIAATYISAYILWRQRATFPEWGTPASTLLIAANFFSLWILSFEVWHSFESAMSGAEPASMEGLRNAQNLSLTAVWAIYAVIGIVIGIMKRWRYVRLGALAFLAVPIIKVFVYDVFKLEMGYRIGAFVGLGLLLLVSAYLYQRYSKVIKGVFIEE
jgi:uncharacterized membrane protein